MAQLTYLALWTITREWYHNGADQFGEYIVPIYNFSKHQKMARFLWARMDQQDKWNVLNGAAEVGARHCARLYRRDANDWFEHELFSLDCVLLPHGGEGHGNWKIFGKCENCDVGLAAWRNCSQV